MLWRVLQEVERAQAPLELNELSRRLEIDRSVLDGIIEFWVRKGRLVEDAGAASGFVCAPQGCGSCSGPQGCPFVMKMPRTISLRRPPP